MPDFAMQDLRIRVLRAIELQKQYEADPEHFPEELKVQLQIPAEEYAKIIEAIRQERRSAEPSKAVKTKAAKAKSAAAAVMPLDDFMNELHGGLK